MPPLVRAALLFPLLLGLSCCSLFRVRPPEYEAVRLPSGLVVQDLVVPVEGPVAAAGDHVELHYEMRLADGTLVDSSYDRGRPVAVTLGDGQLPAGVEEGILGMRCFGRRAVVVPPELGYGEEGREPEIPPDTWLHLVLELMGLEPAVAP